MTAKLRLLAAWSVVSFAATARVSQLLNFQARAAVDGTNFASAGQFKFAIANSIGGKGRLNHFSLPTPLKL